MVAGAAMSAQLGTSSYSRDRPWTPPGLSTSRTSCIEWHNCHTKRQMTAWYRCDGQVKPQYLRYFDPEPRLHWFWRPASVKWHATMQIHNPCSFSQLSSFTIVSLWSLYPPFSARAREPSSGDSPISLTMSLIFAWFAASHFLITAITSVLR